MVVIIMALLLEALPQSGQLYSSASPTPGSVPGSTMFSSTSGYTYNVTFVEEGLPDISGILQIWSLNVSSFSSPSSFDIYHVDSSNLTIGLVNGTYNFTVSTSTGYRSTPSKGIFNVSGSNVLIKVEFSPTLYSITFSESGLGDNQNPSENMIPSWSVSLNNSLTGLISRTSDSSNLSFEVPDGNYTFRIANPSNYSASPSSGNITVRGEPYVEEIVFSSRLFRVTFNESGLPFIGSGSSWGVDISNSSYHLHLNETSNSSSVVFSLPEGNYTYTIGSYSNYTAIPSHANITVSDSNYNVPVYFSRDLYKLVFSESGLSTGNGGTQWGVTIKNVTSGHIINTYTTGSTIEFAVPNGTYSYQVDRLNNYSAFPYNGSGTITLNKEDNLINVEFVPDFFYAEFVEKGLPDISGHVTVWSVSVNKTVENSSTSSILFMLPIFSGKTYTYAAQPVSEFAISTNSTGNLPSPTLSQLVVNGKYKQFVYLINITYVYTQGKTSFKYTTTSTLYPDLVFSQTGLPAGTTWSVGLNNTTSKITELESSSYSSIYFSNQSLPAGKYYFSVYPTNGYIPIVNRSNNVTWNGVDFLNISVKFVSELHDIEFFAHDLPQQLNWTLDLTSSYGITTSYSSNGNPLSINLTNGHYSFRILPVGTFKPDISQGYLTVNNSSVNAYPSFSIYFSSYYYKLSFNETGLPSTSLWSVALVGSNGTYTQQSLGANPITFSVPNGTYYYNFISNSNTTGFFSSLRSGYVAVNGSSLFRSIPFIPVSHTVTFVEKGLPKGSAWSIDINGISFNSSGYGTVQTSLLNGTYFYAVLPFYGFSASNRSGSFNINGNNIVINITFVHNLYPVTFSISGLPASTNWTIVIGNSVYTLHGNSTFYLPNGTYIYYLGEVTNVYTYYPFASGGYFIIIGAAKPIVISYRDFVYTLTLQETGLPNNTNWSIDFNSAVLFSNHHNTINLTLQNGTFVLVTEDYNAYYPVNSQIIVEIQGSSLTEIVKYAISLYQVTFVENNLPAGYDWNLSLKGLYNSSNASYSVSHVYFNLTNGSYVYSVTSVNKTYMAPPSGTFTVSGSPLTIYLNFTEVTYNVTFKESGLPSNTRWSVNLDGAITSTNNTTITDFLTNGTYDYSIGNVAGYHITSTSYGNFTVNGKGVVMDVTYAKNQTTTTPPPPPPPAPAKKPFTLPFYFYEVLIIVIIAGIGIAATIYTQQKKKMNK
ncbi:MAG: hypothetical protein ACP5NK_05230 [Thermoplasmata archaeon]